MAVSLRKKKKSSFKLKRKVYKKPLCLLVKNRFTGNVIFYWFDVAGKTANEIDGFVADSFEKYFPTAKRENYRYEYQCFTREELNAYLGIEENE